MGIQAKDQARTLEAKSSGPELWVSGPRPFPLLPWIWIFTTSPSPGALRPLNLT